VCILSDVLVHSELRVCVRRFVCMCIVNCVFVHGELCVCV